ncbi:MAG: bifunctional 23S rRNA (guanine(2069)-N(7))-methyltransferase RlmK/23S rRNA (guanine(2445)-N(2))-methyltransferase RlmL [Halothiobacillaceae bacterium]|nr:bifunctional 23S rRNA (guanine(2069)-N(7))-methyltransferase RlmK/23S rRNA (guanine(2445)-N(2))-methyltransferase RlmL [Halothiobacillaceae bacterium]HUN00772.1 bifunctional 23S rRNA (guanine(2069)-N(7))-methyltransferase RlmK/23S rRNA (guanine(2445)-N(2))-methyltransferase RlmL [Halothiobacillus sp.]
MSTPYPASMPHPEIERETPTAAFEITWPLTVVSAPDLQAPLAEEIRSLVTAKVSDRPFGVLLDATPEQAYKIICDSLIAGHVYVELISGQGENADELYQLVQRVDWSLHLAEEGYFAISATGATESLRHTGFVATRIKDAIVDQFRDRSGNRPSIDTDQPDIRLHCHLTASGHATLSLELSHGSLHRRGYRIDGGLAPLRETLAAGVLWRARWPQLASLMPDTEVGLFDPMCGSGTLVIEAALRLTGLPTVLRQQRIGSPGWLGHDLAARQRALNAAPTGITGVDPAQFAGKLIGQDIDIEQIIAAKANAERAGVAHLVSFREADAWAEPCPNAFEGITHGLLVSNLPYGHRLDITGGNAYGTPNSAPDFSTLTDQWQVCLNGWHWAVLLAEGEGKNWPLRYERAFPMDQSGIAIDMIRGNFDGKGRREAPGPIGLANRLSIAAATAAEAVDAEPFANRLQKNFRHLKKIIAREGGCCYRVYDADLPDFNLAIDLYHDETGETWADIQEYRAPNTIDPQLARARLSVAVNQTITGLGLAPNHSVVRQRKRQTGSEQYQKITQERLERVVIEGGTRLMINLTDYLDTGLFLDHRYVRDWVAELSRGKSVLNLFCYTATASVRAAHQGAARTLSIDLSHTYLDWAERNFALNNIKVGTEHRLVRADVLEWLDQRQSSVYQPERFDVIFCDPPTFSNSKSMQDTLDIQRDHEQMIEICMHLLACEGILIFSNNLKGFKLSAHLTEEFLINDLSRKTLPPDFARTPHRRSVYEIRHRPRD